MKDICRYFRLTGHGSHTYTYTWKLFARGQRLRQSTSNRHYLQPFHSIFNFAFFYKNCKAEYQPLALELTADVFAIILYKNAKIPVSDRSVGRLHAGLQERARTRHRHGCLRRGTDLTCAEYIYLKNKPSGYFSWGEYATNRRPQFCTDYPPTLKLVY